MRHSLIIERIAKKKKNKIILDLYKKLFLLIFFEWLYGFEAEKNGL